MGRLDFYHFADYCRQKQNSVLGLGRFVSLLVGATSLYEQAITPATTQDADYIQDFRLRNYPHADP